MGMERMFDRKVTVGLLAFAAMAAGLVMPAPQAQADEKIDAARAAAIISVGLDEKEYEAWPANVIGPEKYDNNCASCHALEAEAWQQTTHFATFQTRHRTDEAEKILDAMGQRSMKRAGECLHCHYTSVVQRGRIRPTWGVSCESCHGAAKEWVNIHNKAGGNPGGATIKWGEGKNEPAAQREARIAAAQAKGMIHSAMIYDIAKNCFGCHTVPNEEIVNKGGHKSGSDFDLVAWSQGEVRHNFISSSNETNAPLSTERKRLYYVVGALVDYEVTLRNLSRVTQKGAAFHTSMVERANRVRAKVDKILAAVSLPEVKAAVDAAPNPVDASTTVAASVADNIGAATKKMAMSNDGSALAGVDSLIPTDVNGKPHKP